MNRISADSHAIRTEMPPLDPPFRHAPGKPNDASRPVEPSPSNSTNLDVPPAPLLRRSPRGPVFPAKSDHVAQNMAANVNMAAKAEANMAAKLAELAKEVEAGNFYEAHQQYRTVFHRCVWEKGRKGRGKEGREGGLERMSGCAVRRRIE